MCVCECETGSLHVFVGGSRGWLVSRHHEGLGAALGQFEKGSIVESEAAMRIQATFFGLSSLSAMSDVRLGGPG